MVYNGDLFNLLIALEEKEEKEKAGEVIDEDEETTASRFSALMVKHLLKGFQAKDKNVRLRVVQCMAEMISSIGELEYVLLMLHTLGGR